MRFKKFISIWVVFLSFSFLLNAQESVWPDGWQYRKTLKIQGRQDNCPVERIAVFQFTGKARDDGSDIRVTNLKGEDVPYDLIFAGPGNLYQVCFPVSEDAYYIFYGNPSAGKHENIFVPKRGLFLEVYERKGNPGNTWKDSGKAIEQSAASRCLGRSAWRKIWDAGNPFGPEKDFVKVYKGYFYLDADTSISFATSSAGPSFVFVDDKPVASWPGWHGAEPFIRPEHAGTVDLKAGLHSYVYYHIATQGQEIAVAAIKIPADKQFKVLPDNFFLPPEKVEVVETEKTGNEPAVGFSWENSFYLSRDSFQLTTLKFTPEISGDTKKEYLWDFGDGQTNTETSPSHTYVNKGIRPVTLTIKNSDGKSSSVTLLVNVDQDYAALNIPSKTYYEYLNELGKYRLEKTSTEDLFALAGIFESYSDLSDEFSCYNILARRQLKPSEEQKVPMLAASLAVKTKKFKEAEELYSGILKKTGSSEAGLKLSQVYFLAGDLASAETGFNETMNVKDLPQGLKKQAETGLADIYREKGERTKAIEEYMKISAVPGDDAKTGAYSQQVIYYLKANDFSTAFEKLDDWQADMPLAKMEGLWSVLFARACIISREYEKGMRELETFTRICDDKDNQYLTWVVFLKAQIYENLGEKDKAAAFYGKVIDEFPGSSLSRVAAEKIHIIPYQGIINK